MKPGKSPRTRFGELLALLASQCEKEIDFDMLQFYENAIRPFGWEKACAIMEDIILTRSGRDPFPTPGDLLRYVKEEHEDAASAIAGRVTEAIRRFGSYNHEEARQYIGEQGWALVARFGGWSSLCRNTKADQVPYLLSQLTKSIEAEGKGPARQKALGPRAAGLTRH